MLRKQALRENKLFRNTVSYFPPFTLHIYFCYSLFFSQKYSYQKTQKYSYQKYYYQILLNCFERNEFVTFPSHFSKFSEMLLSLALMLLVPLKRFFMKMNCVLFRIKVNKSHDSVFLKVHILAVHTLCYICINGIFLTSLLVMNCSLSFIWRLIDHKFLSDIFNH